MQNKITQLTHLCQGLDYELFQDKIVMANAAIGAQHYGIDLTKCTPTFILKADDTFVAVIIQGSKKLDFKKISAYLHVKKVTMATRDEILQLTDSPIGSVSMINTQLPTLLDQGIQELDYCYGGCGVEKYTLKINPHHLAKVTCAKIGDFTKDALQ